jgi:hypothetical protein
MNKNFLEYNEKQLKCLLALIIISFSGGLVVLTQNAIEDNSLDAPIYTGNLIADSSGRVEATATSKLAADVYVLQDDGSGTLVNKTSGQVYDREVAKKFYQMNPGKKNTYDLLSIFTTFDDPTTYAYHDVITNTTKGLNMDITKTPSTPGLPTKLLGINFFKDVFSAKYRKKETDITSFSYMTNHETAHQWLAYMGKDEGLSDGVHYSKWFSNGFTRDKKNWSDAMGGWTWQPNADGTYSVANNINSGGFSKLSLYQMGLIPASDVGNLTVLVPDNPLDESYQNVKATLKTIKMADLVAKYGQRDPDYKKSQKNFNMAYILVTKNGDKPVQYQADLDVINKWITKDLPAGWKTATYGKSTINNK